MSTHAGSAAPAGRESRYERAEAESGVGWVMFAGTMIAITGVVNVVYGIAGIGNANWLEANTNYVFSGLETWGWIALLVGIVQLVAAWSIWSGNEFGRVVGIVSASLNAIVMLMFIPAYPFGALAIFAIDVLVIYGLLAYGGRPYPAR